MELKIDSLINHLKTQENMKAFLSQDFIVE